MRLAMFLLCCVIVVAVAYYVFPASRPPNPRDASGGCVLVGEARIVESMGDLVVQPPNGVEWTDVTLTLQGQGVGATNAGLTGPFALTRPAVKGRTALKMETFQKPDGERWVRMVMRPTDVTIEATHAGERCRLTKTF